MDRYIVTLSCPSSFCCSSSSIKSASLFMPCAMRLEPYGTLPSWSHCTRNEACTYDSSQTSHLYLPTKVERPPSKLPTPFGGGGNGSLSSCCQLPLDDAPRADDPWRSLPADVPRADPAREAEATSWATLPLGTNLPFFPSFPLPAARLVLFGAMQAATPTNARKETAASPNTAKEATDIASGIAQMWERCGGYC